MIRELSVGQSAAGDTFKEEFPESGNSLKFKSQGTGPSLGRWGFYFLFCGSVSYMLFTLSFLEDRDSSPSWLCVEETFMKMLSHGVDGWARCSLQSLHGLSWVPFFFSPYEDALYKISSKKVSPTIDHCF